MPDRMGDPVLDAMLDEMQYSGYMTYEDVQELMGSSPLSHRESELRKIYQAYKNNEGW
jgi:hypothetical protein